MSARTHGYSRTPIYKLYTGIIQRCHNPKAPTYYKYGAKGIFVCDEWRRDFSAFLREMGPRPSKRHSVDRIDGSKGYEPGNCRWATPEDQANNRPNFVTKIKFDGLELSSPQWARRIGVSRNTMEWRLKNWPLERALSEPRNEQ